MALGGRSFLIAIADREFIIGNLLVRIHFIIVMIRWTGLATWEVESPFPGSLTFTFLEAIISQEIRQKLAIAAIPGRKDISFVL